MNLFNLDEDHDQSAKYHVDKHVSKMVLESAQILCTNLVIDQILGYVPRNLNKEENAKLSEYRKANKDIPMDERPIPYLPCHQNHPSTVWCRMSLENFAWTHNYCHALAEEYRYRYGKEHKSFWQIVNKLPDPQNMEDIGLTTFGLAMPEDLKDYNDPVGSYRKFYMLDKATFASWKYRSKPDWWDESLASYDKRITRG